MADASWDNSGLPKKEPGMPGWVKILLGCGLAMLLAMGACVGFATWGCNAMTRSMEAAEWGQLRQAVAQLQTDEGARALYQANPGLASRYPDEAAFLKAAQDWRPRLEPLPEHVPSLFTGRVSYNIQIAGGFRRADLGYRTTKGTWIASHWENGRLTTIDIR
ncbi:MAG TPA: hypothetical protein VJ600_00010 [Holophagaceae bacterium]|nr:hypothetical protein [Holophagaceae bacterium]